MLDLDEIKSRINPAYADRRGSESHERKTLCNEIERLRAELALCKPHPDCDRSCMLSCQQEADYAEKLEKELAALRNEIERLQAALQHEKDVAETYKAEAEALRKQLVDAKLPPTPTNEMTVIIANVIDDPNMETSSWDLAENIYREIVEAHLKGQ